MPRLPKSLDERIQEIGSRIYADDPDSNMGRFVGHIEFDLRGPNPSTSPTYEEAHVALRQAAALKKANMVVNARFPEMVTADGWKVRHVFGDAIRVQADPGAAYLIDVGDGAFQVRPGMLDAYMATQDAPIESHPANKTLQRTRVFKTGT